MGVLLVYLLIATGVGILLSRVSRLAVRNIGLVMLVMGIFPWVSTPLLIRDRGMEGSGMMGTLIFIFVGVPGIIWTLIGVFGND